MASALTLMSRGVTDMDLHHGVPGVAGVVLDTAVGAGASYGLGQVYARYRDQWYGKHAPTLAAVAGKVGAVALNMFAHGSAAHWTSGVLDSIGQAGVNAKFLEMGIGHGMKAVNRHVVVLPQGTDTKKLADGTDVLVGALPPAAAGRALSFEQIEELAAMH
jgi:hypothetical protein